MAREPLFRPREVWARLLLGAGGGYLATYGATGLLALVLPMHRSDAAVVAGMAAFAIYTSVFLWAFTAKPARRAWAAVLPFALFGAVVLLRPALFR